MYLLLVKDRYHGYAYAAIAAWTKSYYDKKVRESMFYKSRTVESGSGFSMGTIKGLEQVAESLAKEEGPGNKVKANVPPSPCPPPPFLLDITPLKAVPQIVEEVSKEEDGVGLLWLKAILRSPVSVVVFDGETVLEVIDCKDDREATDSIIQIHGKYPMSYVKVVRSNSPKVKIDVSI